jgi:hypothetical protein
MENFREGAFVFMGTLAIGAIIACSLALDSIATSMPYIILAWFGGISLTAVTVTGCYLRVIGRRERYYLDSPRDYIKAGCREVERPRFRLLKRGD